MLFEELRERWLLEKLKKATNIFIICAVLMIPPIWLMIIMDKGYIILLMPLFFLTVNRFLKKKEIENLLQDIQKSSFAKGAEERDISFKALLNDLSKELQHNVIYQNDELFITKNWLVDFLPVDVKVIPIKQIIWLYKVKHRGSYYGLRCLLEDGSTYHFGFSEPTKIISLIEEQNPHILVGYSNKIETLLEQDEAVFISNIKKGKFPNGEGKWENEVL